MSAATELAKAFENCELDCAQWDEHVLLELAHIAIDALVKSGYMQEPIADE